MKTLTCCPACQSRNLIPTPIPTNVTAADADSFGTGVVSDNQYAVCLRCDLLFARRRQDEGDINAYYAAFQVLEKREYAVYPPPKLFLENQQRLSERILRELETAGVLNGCESVLNVRCEHGVHLANLRDRYGIRDVCGLDHFDSNLRFGREFFDLERLELLHPMEPVPAVDRSTYDLVLANHQITHALQPLELLRRFRQLLSPQGTLVLYNENNHQRLLRRKGIYQTGAINFHKQLLTRQSLQNLCQLAGLSWQHFTQWRRAIRWASSRDTMLVVARRSEPLSVETLPKLLGSPTRRNVAIGRSVLLAYQASKRVEKVFRRRAA